MPVDALPVPNGPLPGTVRFRREYRDALNRPLTGTMTIQGKRSHAVGDVTVLPTPAVVRLTSGVVEIDLPPDVYEYTTVLQSPEGARVTDKGTIDLTA